MKPVNVIELIARLVTIAATNPRQVDRRDVLLACRCPWVFSPNCVRRYAGFGGDSVP